jgi:hypothetical protein
MSQTMTQIPVFGNRREELPSGKIIMLSFYASEIVKESHIYGTIDIGIEYSFKDGAKHSELYFCKSRMVSRKTYEKARLNYIDMPPADDAFEDINARLLKMATAENRKRNSLFKQHQQNPKAAQEDDRFCLELMQKGVTKDAVEWIKDKEHTLGERNWVNSKRLISRLIDLGCQHVYACEIDVYEENENSGNLIVELPEEKESRMKILKKIARMAGKLGFDGPLENGQKYEYIKLD